MKIENFIKKYKPALEKVANELSRKNKKDSFSINSWFKKHSIVSLFDNLHYYKSTVINKLSWRYMHEIDEHVEQDIVSVMNEEYNHTNIQLKAEDGCCSDTYVLTIFFNPTK